MNLNLKVLFCLFALSLCCSIQLYAQDFYQLDSTVLEVTPVKKNIVVPWEIVWGPDNTIWMTHNRGTISRLEPSTGEMHELVSVDDIYNKNGSLNDSRMMGLALHPDFENSPYVYTNYTYQGSSYTSKNWDKYMKIVRYTYNSETDVLTTPTILLDDIPVYDGWHIGGKLLIGPDDKLYVSIGDAKQPESPQNHPDWNDSDTPKPLSLDWYSGKIIRINLDGTVPEDNPYASEPYEKNPRDLTWNIGHRNLQGMVVGPNEKIYYAEHGPSNDDEVGMLLAGKDYGWPEVEGFCDTEDETDYCTNHANHEEPLITWDTPIAPSGLEYYNHDLIPEWKNSLLLATLTGTDRAGEDMRVLHLDASGDMIIDEDTIFESKKYLRLRDICVAPNGEIYFTSSNLVLNKGRTLGEDDIIWKISPKEDLDIPQPELLEVVLDDDDYSSVDVKWSHPNPTEAIDYFRVERSVDDGAFEKVSGQLSYISTSYYDNKILGSRGYRYRIKVVYDNGLIAYSNILEVQTPEYYPPQIVSVELSDDLKPIITWKDSSVYKADAFQIFRSVSNEDQYALLTELPGNKYTYTDTEVDASSEYFYRMKATFDKDTSTYSNAVSIDITSAPILSIDNGEESTVYSLYPNPVSNILHIDNSGKSSVHYKVMDANGKQLEKGELSVGMNHLNLKRHHKSLVIFMVGKKAYKILLR